MCVIDPSTRSGRVPAGRPHILDWSLGQVGGLHFPSRGHFLNYRQYPQGTVASSDCIDVQIKPVAVFFEILRFSAVQCPMRMLWGQWSARPVATVVCNPPDNSNFFTVFQDK